jgi:membrane-associated phospholipid phosphatase
VCVASLNLSTTSRPAVRCVVLGGTALVSFVATYVVAVRTVRGQFLDLLALSGQQVEPQHLVQSANTVLGTISIASVAAVLIGVIAVSVLRKRRRVGFVTVGIVVGSVGTAELLKRVVLSRPYLARASPSDLSLNTLPSGHSTIAMCVAVALILVVPKRSQFAAAVIGTPYAVGIGIATVVAHWHRPSDVVAAWFLVGVFTFFGLVVLRRLGALEADESAPWGTLIGPGLFILVSTATLVLIGTTVFGLTRHLPRVPIAQQRAVFRSALAFGFSLASIAAVACTFVGALLWVLRDSRVTS